MASVVAVCQSQKKGTRKKPVAECLLKKGYGVVGDAHADFQTHRQVSLLAIESIGKMRQLGLELTPGDFAENITTEGIDLVAIPVGTKIMVGDNVVLEMTQLGKECHTACEIRRLVGNCIMPQEGIFARVIRGGKIKAGDKIKTQDKPL
jgi:MOSC domain-containing protein YiiM